MNLSSIFTGGVKEVVGGVVEVFDQLHTSPQERAELEVKVGEIVTERMRVVEESARSRMEMVANVIEAESRSGSRYTANARPTVVYVGVLIYFLNAVMPMFGIAQQVEIDPNFTYVWGGICSVWVAGRSAEKMGQFGKVSSAITGSKPSIFNRIGKL